MSKLVDKERLARLAAALDGRMKAAVAVEKEERMAADAGLQQAINAINDADNGVLAQAKAYADELKGQCDQAMVDHEADQKEFNDDFEDRIATLEGLISGDEGKGLDQIVDDIEANAGEITALKGRMDAVEGAADANADAIAQEVKDRQEAVQGLDERVQAIEDNMAGDIEEAVQALADRHDQEMDDVEDRFEAAEKAIDDLEAKFGEGEGTVGDMIADAVKVVQDDLDAFEAAQAAKEEEQDGRLNALEAKFAGDESVDAKIKAAQAAAEAKAAELDAALKQEVDGKFVEVNAKIQDHETRIKANEDFVAAQPTKDANNLQAAKDYADGKIAALVDSAPEAMDTLNELAGAIKAHEDVYKAYVDTVAADIAKAKGEAIADAQGKDEVLEARVNQKIADDVKAEADRADAAEKALAADIAAINNEENGILAQAKADAAAKVKAEEERALAAEKLLDDAIKALSGEEGALAQANTYTDQKLAQARTEISAEIDADVKVEADRAKLAEQELQGEIDAAEGRIATLEGKFGNAEGSIDNLIKAAQDAADKAQGEVDAVEERVDVLEAFVEAHDHTVMEKGIADNKAAIEKEVEDRDAAIAEALKDFTNTEELKAMLGNVVNSLGIAMADNKLKLTLGGGNSAVTLKEVSLDMATDDDIDAIIAGLDAAAE